MLVHTLLSARRHILLLQQLQASTSAPHATRAVLKQPQQRRTCHKVRAVLTWAQEGDAVCDRTCTAGEG
jgi:hypothetical protein